MGHEASPRVQGFAILPTARATDAPRHTQQRHAVGDTEDPWLSKDGDVGNSWASSANSLMCALQSSLRGKISINPVSRRWISREAPNLLMHAAVSIAFAERPHVSNVRVIDMINSSGKEAPIPRKPVGLSCGRHHYRRRVPTPRTAGSRAGGRAWRRRRRCSPPTGHKVTSVYRPWQRCGVARRRGGRGKDATVSKIAFSRDALRVPYRSGQSWGFDRDSQ